MATSAPTLQTVTSKDQRKAAGVSSFDYVDAYNQSQMAQYNNEYNYWLWQQQQEYNTPANQVARLKEAGLNPNYNSIDGTGNMTSIPTSSGSISASIGSNRIARLSQVTQAVSSIFNNLNDISGTIKNYSQTPDNLEEARRLISLGMRADTNTKLINKDSAEMDNIMKRVLYGIQYGEADDNGTPSVFIDQDKSPYFRNMAAKTSQAEAQKALTDVMAALRNYDLNETNPQKLKNLQAQFDNIISGTKLRDLNASWYDAKNAASMAMMLIKALTPFIL